MTLYGIIDAGVTYTNRAETPTQKGAVVQFTSGPSQGSRWGLKGAEDLGGGLKAIFTLENGFDKGQTTGLADDPGSDIKPLE